MRERRRRRSAAGVRRRGRRAVGLGRQGSGTLTAEDWIAAGALAALGWAILVVVGCL